MIYKVAVINSYRTIQKNKLNFNQLQQSLQSLHGAQQQQQQQQQRRQKCISFKFYIPIGRKDK